MPLVSIKPTSNGALVKEFMARAQSFRNAKIAASLKVGPEASFWYVLEYGSASRQAGDAPVRGSGAVYTIVNRPESGLKSLSWPENGGRRAQVIVHHPGIRPHPFIRSALSEVRSQAKADIINALRSNGVRASSVEEALKSQTMPSALSLIVQNLASAAPGTRADGKLLGRTAAEVFAQAVTVEVTGG